MKLVIVFFAVLTLSGCGHISENRAKRANDCERLAETMAVRHYPVKGYKALHTFRRTECDIFQ